MEFQINFAHNTWFVILGILALVSFSWWTYQFTLPPVANFLRRFLFALRILSLILVFMLIFEPILAISIKKTEKPILALLIDNSSSMQLADQGGTRRAHLLKILSKPWLEKLNKKFDVLPVAFGDSAKMMVPFSLDSLKFNREGTNILQALQITSEKLSGKNYSAALLFSDGAYNMGGDPISIAKNYPVPVYTIALGKNTPDNDIWISEVTTNEVAFANTQVPLEVVIRSTGFAGQAGLLSLKKDGITVLKQKIQMPEDLQERKIRVDFTPENEGVQKYEISLAPLQGEITPKNNRRIFYIKILKSKLKILLLAGSPGPDVSFLLRTLKQDKNLSISSFISAGPNKRMGGQLPGENAVKSIDCVIGVNLFATNSPSNPNLRWLQKAVVQEKKPFLFIAGNIKSLAKLWENRDLILLTSLPILSGEREVVPVPTLQGLVHPILRVKEEPTAIRELITSLPPVFSSLRRLRLHPGAQVLLSSRPFSGVRMSSKSESMPLMAALRQGERRIVAFWGTGFWRWHLMMQRIQPGHDFYEKLMLNSVRWLVSAEESKLLRVTTSKEIFRTGEKIIFTAQAYYEDFTPRENLEIVVKVLNGQSTKEVILKGRGNGIYEGKLNVLAGGDYRYQAIAKEGKIEIGRDKGKFTVEPFRFEFQRTTADRQMLEKLASRTRGKALSPDSLQVWLEKTHFENRVVYENKQIPLWQRWPVLLIVILTLTTEWYIRKRKGML